MDLGTLAGSTFVVPNAINASGEIAGTALSNEFRAVRWTSTTGFQPLLPIYSQTYDINDSGQIVGDYRLNGLGGAFLWSPATHTDAIGQLGTLHRFGRGVPQDLVAAAQLHILAAEAGDSVALGNLSDYLKELEQFALGGNASASVSLATIYDKGLGATQDAATALAWIRWARLHYTPEVDADVLEELERLEFESVLMSTPDVELRAEALLAQMRRSREAIRPS